MKRMVKLIGVICLVSSLFIGCGSKSATPIQDAADMQENVKQQDKNKENKQDPITEQSKEETKEQSGEQQDKKSDDPGEDPAIKEISQDEKQEDTNRDKVEEIERIKLDINNLPVEEQLLKTNRLLVEINNYSVTNSVDITSHDFIDKDMKDFPIKKIESNQLKQEVISLERVENNVFHSYSNILVPRLVKDGIVFIVQDLVDNKVCYIMKYLFSDNSIQPIYTIDASNYENFRIDVRFNSVDVKTTDKCIIYKIYNDAIVYDHDNNIIKNHIRYSEEITDDVFDISSDGEFIAFINKEGSLIVSDLYMKNPKLVMKDYDDPKDVVEGSMPRYPEFSISNPHLLTFRLQGYEWTYGDMLYNVSDETLVKLPRMENEESAMNWVSGDMLIASCMYESSVNEFINLQYEYITLDKTPELIVKYTDYGLANKVIGTPLYTKDNKLIFLDIDNKKLSQIDNVQVEENFVSISSDGQYLITRPNDGSQYELSKIVNE